MEQHCWQVGEVCTKFHKCNMKLTIPKLVCTYLPLQTAACVGVKFKSQTKNLMSIQLLVYNMAVVLE